jgi:hypothetical protein
MVALHFMMSGAAVLSSYASPSLASRRDAGVRGKAAWVAAITLFTHLLILAYDHARAFRAFNWGDRGLERLRILKEFAGLKGAVLPAMTGSPIVPGNISSCCCPGGCGGGGGHLPSDWSGNAGRMAGGAIGGACVFVAAGAAGLRAGLCFSAADLAFPHQLVTEAIVTPLCVVWLYALLAAIRGRTMGLFLLAGGCLGVAILTRPVVLLMLPACFALALACPGARPELRRPGLYAMAGWRWRRFWHGRRSYHPDGASWLQFGQCQSGLEPA